MFIGYEQVAVTNAVQTAAALTIPASTTHVQIQAETRDVRYTMDGTDPTATTGMIFAATAPEPLYEFLSEDLHRIRFIADGGGQGDPLLNFHYSTGRVV